MRSPPPPRRRALRRPALTVARAAVAALLLSRPLAAQTITGHVTDDRTQRPAVAYVVRLVQATDTGLAVLGQTTTDATGTFSVVAPTAGRYLLTFGRTPPRVQRVGVEVEAGDSVIVREFPLPIQRESDFRPYFDVDVDSTGWLEPRAPAIPYPDARRQAREPGSVFAMFVVDTVGRAEQHSVRLFAGTHADFPAVTGQWLAAQRFRIPRVAGVAVRRQVCLPVVFTPEAPPGPARITPPAVPPSGLAVSARALCTRALQNNGIMTVSADPPPTL
ncbi:MAG: carboxypeptidase regulatory-like domain-containing protein [Gemmatimonadota bacterium]|nr:carboxypeptidase regulatory-like domain-containing protein [Gemmatimonadota bacterium]